MYRGLDPEIRRLFLFVSKVLSRHRQTLRLSLRHLVTEVLGFSRSLATRDLKLKVNRSVRRLVESQVVASPRGSFCRSGSNDYRLTFFAHWTHHEGIGQ